MKPKKLASVTKLTTRVVGYVTYIEENRKDLKNLPGNSKSVLAALKRDAEGAASESDKADKLERRFLAARARAKERTANLNCRFVEQMNYAREFAKRHRLAAVREQLRTFGARPGPGRKRKSAAGGSNGRKPPG